MSCYIPEEILFQIFLNLKTKSLRRFLSVSKSWYALITSKDFVSSHLIQPPNSENNSFHLLKRFSVNTKAIYSIYFLDETQNTETGATLGFSSRIIYPPIVEGTTGFDRIVGIENGLMLLFDVFSHLKLNSFLWNPAINVFVTLPCPEIELGANDMHALGFWFDSTNCDFKVMRIVYRSNTDMQGRYDLPPVAEVYSLNKGEWGRVNVAGVECYLPSGLWSHVYLNGRSHWIGYRYDPLCCLILSFDMNDEVFREIMLPFYLRTMLPCDLTITKTMGCLAVIGDGRGSEVCRIWVMKTYGDLSSWTNLCNIPIHIGPNYYMFLGFWKNKDVLLIRNSRQLVLYVPESESLIELDIVLGVLPILTYAGKYEDSLALLDLKSSDK